ncbi:S9 family peptidase [Rossellomorea aquimaris]|uniref:S9 family peptidase n=1 Tax=Rossellomorea aquimaris TaxID=189382 RepID=UPI001CD80F7B|nr:S9 family peptidase [Rossellomorea aquimaris]MCA1057515.1 S9 family peptidase [Rossellomorea aquimaris]
MNSLKEKYLSIEELISLPTLSGTTISEDGQNIAFVKNTANWQDNTYRNHIWIYEKRKDQCSLIGEGTAPSWSPDSRQVAYLHSVEKKNQIFVQSLDGSCSIQMTNENEGVSHFKWQPSSKGFYYIAQSKESVEINKRRENYGDFHHVGKEYRNHCLYYIEINDSIQKAHPLTECQEFHILEFDISNGGKKGVLLTAPSPNMEDIFNRNLYILEVETGELQKLNTDKLLGGSICISSDSSQICYTASIREKEYYKTHIQDCTLEIYDLKTGEFIQPLSDFDSTVMPIRWTSKGIFMKWQDKTNYRIGLLLENGTVEMLSENEDGFVLDASITRDGDHLAYCKAKPNETFEIYVDDQKVTDENNAFKGKCKSNREIISWKSSDDLEIEGVLTTPADFDPHKKYPLLVLIHGGPGWASFPIHSGCFNEKYPVEQFIEKGFIVLEPNYRGSSGYGNDFLKANYRNFGLGDYQDVISGVDALVDRGTADQERVGVMGWSQGGFISAFCSTYSDRFKAASVGGAITNWRSHYVNTDIPYFIRMHLGDTPWNDPEVHAKTSPMNYIQSACTPTLIQHGDMDARVPISNAYDLYQGLKDMDVETEFIIFKGMAYSPDQPGMNVAIMKQNVMWFSHYILGESMNDNWRDSI